MTIRKLTIHAAVALLAATALSGSAFSQEIAVPEEETYGTLGETVVSVDAYDFEGMDASNLYGWEPTTNRRFRTAGTNTLMTAGLNIPNGAQITKVSLTGCDQDAAATMDAALVECPLQGAGGPCNVFGQVFSPAGAPGCGTFTADVTPPRTVDNTTTSYSAFVNLPITGPNLRIRRMAFYYRLQVSPAPATATFTDVPLGHPLHRFVEALAAAGITGGCAAGQFCPDANLTRGQMAVFMATALGLHWPN